MKKQAVTSIALKAITLAEQCAAILQQDFGAQKVYLFGSLAEGYFRRNSDIDLVVEGLDPRYYYKALCRIYQIVENFDVDLIPFEDYKYKDTVLEQGILFDERTKKWKNHPPNFYD
jgi:predicted nucleotidyltransferase